MASLLDKIRPTQSEDMAGVGPDQAALVNDNSEPTIKGYEEKYGTPSEGLEKSLSTGEHSSAQSEGMAGVGPDQSALGSREGDRDVKAYEEKYGKPSEDVVSDDGGREERGRAMAGVGSDQSALMENTDFRDKLED